MTGTGTGTVTLRSLRLDDITRLREWRSRPEVARYMLSDHEIGDAEHARWFGRVLDDPSVRAWIVELDDEPVGYASLSGISREHRRAEWGFYLADPALRGRGVGAATWRRLLEIAFGELDLDLVVSEVLATNERVVDLHRRFGFQIDGVRRRHVRKGGVPVDVVALSLLREEWLAGRDAGDDA